MSYNGTDYETFSREFVGNTASVARAKLEGKDLGKHYSQYTDFFNQRRWPYGHIDNH